jgi:hypothetical protein
LAKEAGSSPIAGGAESPRDQDWTNMAKHRPGPLGRREKPGRAGIINQAVGSAAERRRAISREPVALSAVRAYPNKPRRHLVAAALTSFETPVCWEEASRALQKPCWAKMTPAKRPPGRNPSQWIDRGHAIHSITCGTACASGSQSAGSVHNPCILVERTQPAGTSPGLDPIHGRVLEFII